MVGLIQRQRVEPGAVAVLVDLRLGDLREVVEADSVEPLQLIGAGQDAPDRLTAGEVAEISRVVMGDVQARVLCRRLDKLKVTVRK